MNRRVLVIRNAYQQDAGGAEQYAINLALALDAAGHTAYLVTDVRTILHKANSLHLRTIEGRWYSQQGWDRSYYLRYPLTVLWYVYIILRYRIDVVHPQSRDDFVFATRAANLLRKKIVWTDHADLKHVLDNVNHFNPRIRKWVIKASRKASAIMCVSHSELKAIQAVAPDLPTPVVVHNGSFLPANVRPQQKTNDYVIGTNARLVPDKGIAELIKGFAELRDASVDLWLLGSDSGNTKKYEELARVEGVSARVKFLGYVSDPSSYVAAMDIFVHASYHEGLSLAVIEAAMLERPIIATDVGGTPEIIDESCALFIRPGSPEDITKALQKLHSDKRLAALLAKKAKI